MVNARIQQAADLLSQLSNKREAIDKLEVDHMAAYYIGQVFSFASRAKDLPIIKYDFAAVHAYKRVTIADINDSILYMQSIHILEALLALAIYFGIMLRFLLLIIGFMFIQQMNNTWGTFIGSRVTPQIVAFMQTPQDEARA
jgi:hypothetical protein